MQSTKLKLKNKVGKNKNKTSKDKQSVKTDIQYPKYVNDAKDHKYSFWENKPVMNIEEPAGISSIIENNLIERPIYASSTPINLPATMKWENINLNDDELMNKVSEFLNKNYVSDPKNKIISVYTINFLRWVIGENGCILAIISIEKNEICGVISASCKNVTVFDKTDKFASVNFLCADPKYRTRKIANILIDEMTRHLLHKGYNQACFTTDRYVPTPRTTIRYYHRPLNYKKLHETKYMILNEEIEKTHEKLLVTKPLSDEFVKLNETHLKSVYDLYNKFMVKYNICCKYTEDELKEQLLNKFVTSYVIIKNDIVVDFVSYYKLSYNITDSSEQISAGHLYLYSANNVDNYKIMDEVLKIATQENLDVFIVNDTNNMAEIIATKTVKVGEMSDSESYGYSYQFKFLKSCKKLHFNFYNWKCPEVKPNQISWFTF